MPTKFISTIHPKSSSDIYQVLRGISSEHITKLISYAKEDQFVKTHTTDFINVDGTSGRFSSLESYITWQDKGRFIYTLVNDKSEFSGIMWFSHEPQNFDDITYDFTFGIRLYSTARGIGLAKPFYHAVFDHFQASNDYLQSNNRGIWLRTQDDNFVAINTYKSLGYNQIMSDNLTHKITMVLQYQSL